MKKHKALFGLMIACSVGLVTLGACGDDDDDSGANGASGGGGKGGSAGGGGTGGTGGTPSAGASGAGGGAAASCGAGIDKCANNPKCAKALSCVLTCGQAGSDPVTALTKCLTALSYSQADLEGVTGTLLTCRTGAACGAVCMPAAAGSGGAGGAAAGSGGAGGAAAGAAGAGGDTGGGAGGPTGPTCPPDVNTIEPVRACGQGAETISPCFACFCDN
jgi:hypothetical protein